MGKKTTNIDDGKSYMLNRTGVDCNRSKKKTEEEYLDISIHFEMKQMCLFSTK